MFAVVYLLSAKKNVIIPQHWIFGFNQEKVNNIGKTSYQNQRIFWSNHGLSHNEIPDESIEANFHLPLSDHFPPQSVQTCYIGRVKRYCCGYFRTTFLCFFFLNINLF